jgi:WD40 repeat protein
MARLPVCTFILSLLALVHVLSLAKHAFAQPAVPYEIIVNSGHTGAVLAAAVSPGGNYLVTAGNDKTARVWDFQSGRLLRIIPNVGELSKLQFTRDPNVLIASGDTSGDILIMDIRSDVPTKILKGHTSFVLTFEQSHDSRYLVSGSYDGTVRLWDISTGDQTTMWSGNFPVGFVGFLPGGDQFAASTHDGTTRIWDLHTKRLLQTITVGMGEVQNLLAEADKLLSFVPQRISVWDLTTGRVLQTLSLDPVSDRSLLVQTSPDGNLIAALDNSSLKIFEAKDGKLITRIGLTHSSPESSKNKSGSPPTANISHILARTEDLEFGTRKPARRFFATIPRRTLFRFSSQMDVNLVLSRSADFSNMM